MNEQNRPYLEEIKDELIRIDAHTSFSWIRFFLSGLLQGAGFIIGTVIAIAVAGWILSVFGIIPGIGVLAQQLHSILQTQSKLH